MKPSPALEADMTLSIETIQEPTQEEQMAIFEILRAFNLAHGVSFDAEKFLIVLRDAAGEMVGGATGDSRWGWLFVGGFAVIDAYRGQGWGTRLMAKVETLARDRHCHTVWLDTYSFQAKPFYEKLGFSVFATMEDYPPGHQRFILSKKLVPLSP
jgi:GNAT superfamily N-acetyltransferase